MQQVLDHGYVKLVTAWGDDLSPLKAARMSTGNPTGEDDAKDDRLRDYLWRHGHATPFEMAGLSVEIQAPLFVARQIFRHRTFSFNEFSGRYAEMPDLFYIPGLSRIQGQAASNKQASGEGLPPEVQLMAQAQMAQATRAARLVYESLIAKGVARETARMVLPLNQYTRWQQQGNLRNWFHFLSLRLDEHTQCESRQYAEAVAALIQERWPKTWEVFERHTLKGGGNAEA
jgi:thymidylate synthase (FAD)